MTKEERKEYMRKYYDRNRKKILEKTGKYHKENKELRKEYYQKYYEKNKEEIDEGHKRYKEENIGYDKRYYEEHKVEMKMKSKEYYLSNRDEVLVKSKEYYNDVCIKKKRNEYMKKYLKKRKEEDPLFNIISSIRSLVYSSIKNQGYSKESRTQEILGCSYIELKNHLESKFIDGMSWGNKGEWHIDHIKPTSLAKTKEEVYELNRYTNLQPLWAIDNIRKGNKYNIDL